MKNDLHQTVLLCRKEIMGTSMVYSKCSLFEEDGYNIVSCTSHNTIRHSTYKAPKYTEGFSRQIFRYIWVTACCEE